MEFSKMNVGKGSAKFKQYIYDVGGTIVGASYIYKDEEYCVDFVRTLPTLKEQHRDQQYKINKRHMLEQIENDLKDN